MKPRKWSVFRQNFIRFTSGFKKDINVPSPRDGGFTIGLLHHKIMQRTILINWKEYLMNFKNSFVAYALKKLKMYVIELYIIGSVDFYLLHLKC